MSRLKQQPGKDILVFGSTELVNALVRHGLVDEFRLMVFQLCWVVASASSKPRASRGC